MAGPCWADPPRGAAGQMGDGTRRGQRSRLWPSRGGHPGMGCGDKSGTGRRREQRLMAGTQGTAPRTSGGSLRRAGSQRDGPGWGEGCPACHPRGNGPGAAGRRAPGCPPRCPAPPPGREEVLFPTVSKDPLLEGRRRAQITHPALPGSGGGAPGGGGTPGSTHPGGQALGHRPLPGNQSEQGRWQGDSTGMAPRVRVKAAPGGVPCQAWEGPRPGTALTAALGMPSRAGTSSQGSGVGPSPGSGP